MNTETRQKRTEEEIVSDLESELRKRKHKILSRHLVKSNAYMKSLERTRKVVVELATAADWPTEEPYTKKLLDLIEHERTRLLEANDTAP